MWSRETVGHIILNGVILTGYKGENSQFKY